MSISVVSYKMQIWMLQTYCVLSEIGVQKLEYQVGLVTVDFWSWLFVLFKYDTEQTSLLRWCTYLNDRIHFENTSGWS